MRGGSPSWLLFDFMNRTPKLARVFLINLNQVDLREVLKA